MGAADVSRTIADGTRTQALGERTFAHLRAKLDAIVTVTEAEIVAAVRLAAERPSRRRAVRRPGDRRDGLPRRGWSCADLDGPIGRGRQRRERRSGRVSRVPGRRRSPAEARSPFCGRRARRPSRSARRGSRTRIAASSSAACRSVRSAARVLGAHPAEEDRHHRRDEDHVADQPHEPGREAAGPRAGSATTALDSVA